MSSHSALYCSVKHLQHVVKGLKTLVTCAVALICKYHVHSVRCIDIQMIDSQQDSPWDAWLLQAWIDIASVVSWPPWRGSRLVLRNSGDFTLRYVRDTWDTSYKWIVAFETFLKVSLSVEHWWAWWLIGRFVAFSSRGRGFESRSSHHIGTLGKSFIRSCLWRFGMKLWHSICAVSGAPLSSRGLETVL